MSSLLQTIEKTRLALDTVPDDKKIVLMDSMTKLTKKLVDNVSSFADLPDDFFAQTHPAIINQIAAAEKRTEKAADDIMSATETIMKAMGNIEGDEKAAIQNAVNAIFEASSFQDLVAQHLNEIKLRINDFSEDMKAFRTSMNDLGGSNNSDSSSRPVRKEKRPDAHLLNGPTTDF